MAEQSSVTVIQRNVITPSFSPFLPGNGESFLFLQCILSFTLICMYLMYIFFKTAELQYLAQILAGMALQGHGWTEVTCRFNTSLEDSSTSILYQDKPHFIACCWKKMLNIFWGIL